MELADPYSQAKATLRENVKWLATCFSGAVAIVLAGTPFVGFGALEVDSEPFRHAVGGLMLGTGALLVAIAYLFYMLRPDVIYPDYVRDAEVTGLGWIERREISALRKEFDKRRAVMFPKGISPSVDTLETEIERLWQSAQGDATTTDGQRWAHYRTNLYNIYAWAAFARFHRRVRRGIVVVALLGLAALMGLSLFAWHVASKKKHKDNPDVTIVNVLRAPDLAPLGQLRTVYFATGKSDLSPDSLTTIEQVRADARSRPRAVVLLYAYTDTVGTGAFNARLARDRVLAVQRALVVPGGVSRGQVLVAELPETSLPAITEEERTEQRNRAVDLIVTELPERNDPQAVKR